MGFPRSLSGLINRESSLNFYLPFSEGEYKHSKYL